MSLTSEAGCAAADNDHVGRHLGVINVFKRLAKAMEPDGFLALGAAASGVIAQMLKWSTSISPASSARSAVTAARGTAFLRGANLNKSLRSRAASIQAGATVYSPPNHG